MDTWRGTPPVHSHGVALHVGWFLNNAGSTEGYLDLIEENNASVIYKRHKNQEGNNEQKIRLHLVCVLVLKCDLNISLQVAAITKKVKCFFSKTRKRRKKISLSKIWRNNYSLRI